MAVVDLPVPASGGPGPGAGLQEAASGGLSVRVFDAGLACCAVEVAAALRRLAVHSRPGPATVNVLVVAGTVTDKLAPLVLRAYRDTPGPRRVLSFGACSNSGGPYWDSYCVTKGVDQIIPVDVYVPGCPPRPEALLDGLGLLLRSPGQEPGTGPAGVPRAGEEAGDPGGNAGSGDVSAPGTGAGGAGR